MPAIRYTNLGQDLRISDIVFAGSHDASITTGSSYAKTQYKNVYEQADAGVRIFDLRILAHGDSTGARLVGYHGSGTKPGSSTFTVQKTGQSTTVEYVKGINGEFGLRLRDMLKDAKRFVKQTGEFLIFKFDKCTNWRLIADLCLAHLGDTIYKPTGSEFAKQSLQSLAGKVVCVFNETERVAELADLHNDGILGYRNLNGSPPATYNADYSGLQYYGKGGTRFYAAWKTNAGKMDENKKKQRKLMAKMTCQSDQAYTNVLGMLYWTSTGSVSSIKERNKKMWKDSGVAKMRRLWEDCLQTAIQAQLDSDDARYMDYDNGARIKSFFPNIIMIDFADQAKCDEIYSLNTIAEQRLGAAFRAYDW